MELDEQEGHFNSRCSARTARIVLFNLKIVYLLTGVAMVIVSLILHPFPVLLEIGLIRSLLDSNAAQIVIAIIGLVGVWFDNPRTLHINILAMFALILAQFTFACSCLDINADQQETILEVNWHKADEALQRNVQEQLQCCGFRNPSLPLGEPLGHPSCAQLRCCSGSLHPCCTGAATGLESSSCPCSLNCLTATIRRFNLAMKTTGGIALPMSLLGVADMVFSFKYHEMLCARAVFTRLF